MEEPAALTKCYELSRLISAGVTLLLAGYVFSYFAMSSVAEVVGSPTLDHVRVFDCPWDYIYRPLGAIERLVRPRFEVEFDVEFEASCMRTHTSCQRRAVPEHPT
jgi:hypothetical protein